MGRPAARWASAVLALTACNSSHDKPNVAVPDGSLDVSVCPDAGAGSDASVGYTPCDGGPGCYCANLYSPCTGMRTFCAWFDSGAQPADSSDDAACDAGGSPDLPVCDGGPCGATCYVPDCVQGGICTRVLSCPEGCVPLAGTAVANPCSGATWTVCGEPDSGGD